MKEDSPLKKAVKNAKANISESKAHHLEQKINELTEALQRERADSTNIRRRAEEDRMRMAGYYKANVVRELLPALDNLDRAIKHMPNNNQATTTNDKNKNENGNSHNSEVDSRIVEQMMDWARGIIGVQKQIDEALKKLGVERIKTIGEVFNPEFHEAISMEEGDGDQEVVSEELQAGYILGDEVIRHAMVKVKS